MKIYLKTLICILILGLSGCQNGNNAKHSRDRLISTKWIFLGFQHNDSKSYESVPFNLSEMNITFSISHSFQAESSCNTAYGNYLIYEQNSLKIDSVVMTKMFCIDSTQSTWEDKYISGLKSSKGFEINNDTLSISTTSNIEMIFKVETQKTRPGNQN
jgi:heat shock protein HslJ